MSVTFLSRPFPAIDLEAAVGGAVVAYRDTADAGAFLLVDAQGRPEWLPMARVQLLDDQCRRAVAEATAVLQREAVAA